MTNSRGTKIMLVLGKPKIRLKQPKGGKPSLSGCIHAQGTLKPTTPTRQACDYKDNIYFYYRVMPTNSEKMPLGL